MIGPIAYKLDLLVGLKIHNVFHVSNLKKKIGSLTTIEQQLPPLSDNLEVIPQPEVVLDIRVITKDKTEDRGFN